MMPRRRPDDAFSEFTHGFAFDDELVSPPNPRQARPLERVEMLSRTMLNSTSCVVQPVAAGEAI